jgi:hypothetical protein
VYDLGTEHYRRHIRLSRDRERRTPGMGAAGGYAAAGQERFTQHALLTSPIWPRHGTLLPAVAGQVPEAM